MGIDLKLWPAPLANIGSVHTTQVALHLDRDSALFDRVRGVRTVPVPFDWRVYDYFEDTGMERITEDAYGEPLTMVFAEKLAAVPLSDDTSCWNRATWAYLRELPPDTPVVLYWH